MATLTLAGSATRTAAQDVLLPFDDSSFVDNGALWSWWGGATRSWYWDATNDAAASPSSGSMRFDMTFSGTGDNQYSIGMSLSGLGAYHGGVTLPPANYDYFEMDIKWDTNSTFPVATYMGNGDPQGLGLGLATTGWGQTWIPYADNPHPTGSGDWEHFIIPINNTWPDFPGLIFKHWFPAEATYSGTVGFWVDNVKFHYSGAPPPPPMMSIKFAKKGVTFTAIVPGSQYQRESIRSIPADTTQWIGNPDPVTYSLTIADHPGAAYPNIQTHVFLVPDTTGGIGPDYADQHAIMLDIRATAGGGNATFRYKTNQPAGNSQMYNPALGQLAVLDAPSVKGTWSLSFNNDTNITVSGPGGASTNFLMPPESAALFQTLTPSMGTYVGVQPNQPSDIGQGVTLSQFKVTSGATVVVDDTFGADFPGVDPSLWIVLGDGGTNAIQVVTNEPAAWVSWTLPAPSTNVLLASPNVNGPYTDPGLPIMVNGNTRRVFFLTPALPSADSGFFYMSTTNSP